MFGARGNAAIRCVPRRTDGRGRGRTGSSCGRFVRNRGRKEGHGYGASGEDARKLPEDGYGKNGARFVPVVVGACGPDRRRLRFGTYLIH